MRATGSSIPYRWLVWGAGFASLYVALTVFAAGAGVRGSDQYWYLGDLESWVMRGLTTSDTIFPVGLLGPGGTLSPAFIHNTLSLYLAGVPAALIGSYGGWIALNVLATLATACLIFLAARTVAGIWAAAVCAVLYPLLPVTFWHATQPLAEASTALFAALAIYLLAIAGTRPWRWLAVVGAVGLLYYSRDSYLPLLLSVPIGFLIVRSRADRDGLKGAVAPTVGLGAAVIGIVAAAKVLFPADNVAFSYTRLLHTAVPGQTNNMWFNFDLSVANLTDRLPFDLGLVQAKLAGHLVDQFVRFDSLPGAVFYWTFNLLSLLAIVMLWRCRHRPAALRLTAAALSLVAIHLVTIAVFQNQVRYTVPALPGLLVVLAIALSDVRWLARIVARRTLLVVLLMTIIAVVPLGWIARTQRTEAAEAATIEQAARTLFEAHVAADDPTIIEYAAHPQVLAYAADDRTVLHVLSTYTVDEFNRLRAAFPAGWLLAPIDSASVPGLGANPHEAVGTIDVDGVTWGLFDLPDRP